MTGNRKPSDRQSTNTDQQQSDRLKAVTDPGGAIKAVTDPGGAYKLTTIEAVAAENSTELADSEKANRF